MGGLRPRSTGSSSTARSIAGRRPSRTPASSPSELKRAHRAPAGQALGWGRVTLVSIPVLFVAAAWSGTLDGKPVIFNGGLGLAAVVYAFWEPFVAWGVMASLLVVFSERFNAPSAAWQRWCARAYGAFIVHAPIVVGLSVALAGSSLPPLLKFAIVGASSIAASFAIAVGLLRLPGAGRVI